MRQWQDLMRRIVTEGEDHSDRTGIGTRRIFGQTLRFDLRTWFPAVTTKRLPFRWAAEELVWILSGSTNSGDLEARGVDIWKEWAGEDGDLGPTYGFQLRNFGADYPAQNLGHRMSGYDQIRWLCNEIENNPGSRRLILTYWNPEQLNVVQGVFPPCHVAVQYHVSGHHLSASLFQRSADVFLGLPFDIAQHAMLVHLLAAASGLRPGALAVFIGDAHLYDNHSGQVSEVLSRGPLPTPRLKILDPLSRIKGAGFDGVMRATADTFELEGYMSHGKVDAPVAV